MRTAIRLLVAAGWLAVAASASSAQVLRGTVREELTGRVIVSAEVLLIDSAGRVVATGVSDEQGGFAVAAPSPGPMRLQVVGEGYQFLDTPYSRVSRGAEVVFDIELLPTSVEIPGIEVSVEKRASQLLSQMGLTPAQLGNRWIDRTFIESVETKLDIGDVIRRKGVPGAYVVGAGNTTSIDGPPTLCIQLQRGRILRGGNTCALLVLDGAVVSSEQLALKDPDSFEAIAVLVPTEAAQYWGTMGGKGAVLFWTAQGKRR